MTMTNAEWCIKNGIQFKNLCFNFYDAAAEIYSISIGYCDNEGIYRECYKGEKLGNGISESILSWLDMEHKEPILDEAEKKYLSAVIKPFRDNVKFIEKCEYHFSSGDFSQIFIRIENKWNGDRENMFFPEFIKGTMYKGMEADRMYTLKELGL